MSVVDTPSNARCGIQVVGKSAGGVPKYLGKAFTVSDSHFSVLPNCSCKACMDGRKRCGYPECAGVAKAVKMARKVAADPAKQAGKAMRSQLRAALDSADPWMREVARGVLSRGQD